MCTVHFQFMYQASSLHNQAKCYKISSMPDCPLLIFLVSSHCSSRIPTLLWTKQPCHKCSAERFKGDISLQKGFWKSWYKAWYCAEIQAGQILCILYSLLLFRSPLQGCNTHPSVLAVCQQFVFFLWVEDDRLWCEGDCLSLEGRAFVCADE